METRAEVDRLRQVYRGYAQAGFGDSKWSRSNAGNRAIQSERVARTKCLLQDGGSWPLGDQQILEVGCGHGEQLAVFAAWGACPARLFGVDLMPERIATAEQAYPDIQFKVGNAEQLPFRDGFFDLVLVSTVLSSILDPAMALNVCREVDRVLSPGGAVIWYDFRLSNPLNHHVRPISRRRIAALFPGYSLRLQTVSLLPPLARRLGRLTDRLYAPLQTLPFLRTHLLGLLRKPLAGRSKDRCA